MTSFFMFHRLSGVVLRTVESNRRASPTRAPSLRENWEMRGLIAGGPVPTGHSVRAGSRYSSVSDTSSTVNVPEEMAPNMNAMTMVSSCGAVHVTSPAAMLVTAVPMT
jgi:hypothetical protein